MPESGKSAEELFPAVYDELRRVAATYLRGERSGHTLQPTALVHEAFLKVAAQDAEFSGRTHLFAVAARAMRQLLIDHARGRDRDKRGGGWYRVTLDPSFGFPSAGLDGELLLTIDAVLERFATLDPRAAEIVELKWFGGATTDEIAEHLGVSKRTVESDWTHARAWLRRELSRMTAP